MLQSEERFHKASKILSPVRKCETISSFFSVRSYLSNRPGHEPRVRHDHPEVEVDRAAEAALEKEVAKLDGGHGLQVQEDLLKLGRGGHGDDGLWMMTCRVDRRGSARWKRINILYKKDG